MYAGIDIGGTSIKYGIVTADGEIRQQASVPTNPTSGKDAMIDQLQRIVRKLSNEAESIGVGFPSVVNPSDGCIYHPPNLPGWGIVPLRELLQSVSIVPVAIDNDANVAAFAEASLGAGKHDSHFLYITLGTGVGGGIIVNHRIFTGERGGSGECGHILINVDAEPEDGTKPTFRTGTLEEAIGRHGLIRMAQNFAQLYPDSLLHQVAELDVKDISEAALRHDKAALLCLERAGKLLGLGLCSILAVLDMRIVVVGGGISQAHPILLDTARTMLKTRALPTIAPEAEIRPARFGSTAGLVGAAMLGKLHLDS
ncbi:MAG: ROK family protein [Bacteroidota bacterium]|nr:ROK family protein [Candidatus Kapabacteria bacterium]MDW8220233.1 ROK family protein [Bacteroidota bacterium]